MAAADYTQVAQQIYLAYFGRPADHYGLLDMTAALAASNAPMDIQSFDAASKTNPTIKAILDNFGGSDESKALYGTGGDAAFINAIYNNVLGRDAEVGGLDFWVAALKSGAITRANAAVQIIAAASKPDAAPDDLATVTNKVAVATTFTANLDETSEIVGYSGDAAAAQARNLLATVNGTTAPDSFAAAIDSTIDQIAHPPVPAISVALSTGVDFGTKFTGTAGNDIFNGTIDNAVANSTLTSGDNLVGGAGNDSLNITATGGGASSAAGFTLAGIERVQVQAVGTGSATLNMGTSTGVTTLATSGSTQDVLFTNVTNKVAAEMANGSAGLSITYGASVVSGTADAATLNVSGQTAGTFTTNGIETLTINTSGAASSIVLATGNDHTNLVVSGSGDLTLAAGDVADDTLDTVNASGLTGNLTLTGLGHNVTKVIGGSGNDSITVAVADLVAATSIDGGAGNDTLKLDGAVSAAAAANVKNFENVSFTTAADITQDASAFAAATLKFNAGAHNIAVTSLGAAQAVSVTASATSLTTTLKTDTTADKTTVSVGGAAAVIVGNVTVNNAETVALVSGGTAANTITTFVDSAATKVTIAATKGLTIGTFSAASVTTIDASASTADVTIGAVAGATTILGGSGNDSFTGSAAADSIIGGAGNDTIIGGGGKDTIDGGVGDDSLRGGAGNDVITGGDGNDTIDLSTAAGGTDNVSGGNGDDTILLTFASLGTSGSTTIAGGAGNDTLTFTGDTNMNFGTDPTTLNNVTGVESFGFTDINGKTVTVNDGTVSAMGGTLNLTTSSNHANTFDASAVLASSSKVVFTADSSVTVGQTYSIGNGIDSATMTSGADTVVVSNNAYLSANDTLTGGAGSDILSFTNTTGATITAAQLSHVTGFETFSISTGGAGNYVFNLTDALIAPNATSLGAFSVIRNAADTGTLKVDASAVTSLFNLTLTGAAGNDVIIGGAGADTITGGLGVNALTGGAGSDTFVFASTANGVSTIADFNFGTSTTAVDVLDVTASAGHTIGSSVVKLSAGGDLNGAGVAVLDTTTYSNAAAAAAAANAANSDATATHDELLIWQDTLGTVHVSLHTDVTSNSAVVDLATFTGLTITGVAAIVNAGDFALHNG
jgi:Ca2+-binding RTX toxin-like protein